MEVAGFRTDPVESISGISRRAGLAIAAPEVCYRSRGGGGNTIKSSWKKAREGKSRSITFRENNSGFKGGRREVPGRGDGTARRGWNPGATGRTFRSAEQMEAARWLRADILSSGGYNTRDAAIDESQGSSAIAGRPGYPVASTLRARGRHLVSKRDYRI